jgi:hypothetical protein
LSYRVLTVVNLVQLVFIPALLIAWQAVGGTSSFGAWVLRTVAVGFLLLLMDRLLDWSFLSTRGRVVMWVLFAIALVYSGMRAWRQPLWVGPEGRTWIPVVASILIIVGAAVPLANSLRGLSVPGEPVALSFPFRDGCFHVAHGGSRKIINGHMKVAARDLYPWRGQMWGLDVFKLYPAGNRTRGFFPETLEDYAIFGEPVYAPCGGEVVATETELPDLIPPDTDTVNKAGNYVLLTCGDEAVILLAHLKQGSVTVRPGEWVTGGDRLGEIGNSGNTTEPHLHISAQHGIGDETILDAEPRAMTFDGDWLVRNDVVCSDGKAD